MDISIHNSSEKVSVSDEAFSAEFNETLVHQLVVSFMSASRAGTKAQKTRSDVRGGGAKPFRQKGTGRARAGTIRSPLWRSGGTTFAARPRDYGKKLNKKMYRTGMRSIVSELIRQDRLIVVEDMTVAEPKTKLMAAKMADLGITKGLVLTDGLDSSVYLAARNIPNLMVMDASIVDPLSLVSQEKVIVDQAALKKLEERLS
ncbi:MAG: 50S ribosomal protein L4 [Gammaproteobacteria bacterium]|jgi:large subunit ribosomal protein L4|nr:50S ribosomal protein L4 [Gammaproteobacteria bacterium]MBT4859795.1 50S ribosomal protein L4 [Gammaproteobacteria bacterium]MBT6551041.1 50S ribosomal protein L4 [Gammaproteobacteria bacterium]MBT6701369.1 50S ribosomal protein L4 [Gammaproteobacteria bacterium]MBT7047607.1 50S ribosomal protein L4 [Gammaproteobacteria bacterium]